MAGHRGSRSSPDRKVLVIPWKHSPPPLELSGSTERLSTDMLLWGGETVRSASTFYMLIVRPRDASIDHQ